MKIEITCQILLQYSDGPLSLWIPVPANTSYQSVLNRRHEGNYTQAAFFSDLVYEAPALHARWEEGTDNQALTVTIEVETQERLAPLAQVSQAGEFPGDVKRFLEPTAHIPTDGIVEQRAGEIVAGRSDPLDKARAIYDWIIENTHRDFQVEWCGLGDVRTMLKSSNLCGKCVDINSLLVALARAAGIPSREVFGIRAAESDLGSTLGRSGDISSAQHCKGEVYLHGAGWVPMDPADVVKAADEEQPAEVIGRVRDYFFGNAEGNWIAFNHARDFTLNPAQAGKQLNYFMYPYGENEGEHIELKPGNPGYSISSRVLERR